MPLTYTFTCLQAVAQATWRRYPHAECVGGCRVELCMYTHLNWQIARRTYFVVMRINLNGMGLGEDAFK